MTDLEDAIELLHCQTKEARLYLKRIDSYCNTGAMTLRYSRGVSQVMEDFLQQVKAEVDCIPPTEPKLEPYPVEIDDVWRRLNKLIEERNLTDLPGSPSFLDVYKHIEHQLGPNVPELRQLRVDIDAILAYQWKNHEKLR